MQPVDFTTLCAIYADFRTFWLPARLEQVIQRDRTQLALALRTLDRRGWLRLCWHPQAAHLCLSSPPPKGPDTFTFSDQLRHQLKGLALVDVTPLSPWERVLDFQFARRPGDPLQGHLYVEIMGKYSNVILTNAENLIITAAHQVSAQQSRVRPILTGQPYEPPPAMTGATPRRDESFERWQERISLIPDSLRRNLLKPYRGLSSALVRSLCAGAQLDPETPTDQLSDTQWRRLFDRWQQWLAALDSQTFEPGWTDSGYTVLGWDAQIPADSIQSLIDRYYSDRLNQQLFQQLRHQLSQKLSQTLKKLHLKQHTFQDKLSQSADADQHRHQADLLMAHLQDWTPGMTDIVLADFETGDPITIPLDPEKNAVSNAQALYKRHQKLRRAKQAVQPLLRATEAEISYLQQVEAALDQLGPYQRPEDLSALEDIRDELVEQEYLASPHYRPQRSNDPDPFHHFQTPSGFDLLVGRNNRQNDQLSFRMASEYDLWFHTQEIPGSHVLLRLPPGTQPDAKDLQFAADIAAYYSRARDSDAAPVVYADPKYVYKPKGAKPGMAIYKHETVLWGNPGEVENQIEDKKAGDKI
ncbi:NFACT family protein [Phormidium yuhuli AB48]|uniref:Rqc2 homolog RqcH n=1 Tax=Phormidium yuhuli AB48 TaxID=2940671 RepID=A0ABY5ASM5_9CYAN|nr:NFACT RNA binding domain-containing protein [Phormidium yuhuli]USR92237.1 NFACT family protein [Phormidium yuhuli AB48]